MHPTTLLLALLTASLSLAEDDFSNRCDAPYPNTFCNTTAILAYQSSSCTPYHVFIARGSDEPYPGRLGNITSRICSQFSNGQCTFENIEYPAKSTAWGKEEWCKSAAKGAKAGQAQLRAYASKCPESKLVALGFSQGASVVQDVLGGGGGKVFECDQETNAALDRESAPGANIVAAVTFGAVIRSKNQNFTMGDTKSFDGRRGRTPEQIAALNKYAGVLRDYCHFGDPMCAVGSEPANVWVHLDYFLGHNEEVVPWVAQKAKSTEVKVSAQPPREGNSTQIIGLNASKTASASSSNTQTGMAAQMGGSVGVVLAASLALSALLL